MRRLTGYPVFEFFFLALLVLVIVVATGHDLYRFGLSLIGHAPTNQISSPEENEADEDAEEEVQKLDAIR